MSFRLFRVNPSPLVHKLVHKAKMQLVAAPTRCHLRFITSQGHPGRQSTQTPNRRRQEAAARVLPAAERGGRRGERRLRAPPRLPRRRAGAVRRAGGCAERAGHEAVRGLAAAGGEAGQERGGGGPHRPGLQDAEVEERGAALLRAHLPGFLVRQGQCHRPVEVVYHACTYIAPHLQARVGTLVTRGALDYPSLRA